MNKHYARHVRIINRLCNTEYKFFRIHWRQATITSCPHLIGSHKLINIRLKSFEPQYEDGIICQNHSGFLGIFTFVHIL